MAPKKNNKKNDEEYQVVKKASAKKKTASKSSPKGNNESMGFIKKLIFLVMTLLIVVLGGFVYLLINFDSYKAKLAEKIVVKLDKVTVDPAKLTEKETKVRLHFKVTNQVPFVGVIFKNLTFDLNLGDAKVAKGMQAEASVALNPKVETSVVIACKVDSITARRAITKSIEKNAGKLLSALLNEKSVKKEIGENIKAITTVKGTADLMIKLGSLEVPFTKKVEF